jgi:hypothetical protein
VNVLDDKEENKLRTRHIHKVHDGSLPQQRRPLYQRLTPLGWISMIGLGSLLLVGFISIANLLAVQIPSADASTRLLRQPETQVIPPKPTQVVVVTRLSEPVVAPTLQQQPVATPLATPRALVQPTPRAVLQPASSTRITQPARSSPGKPVDWITALLSHPIIIGIVSPIIMIIGVVIADLIQRRRDHT